MSKLGRFAAACAAVVCAFGAWAGDNPFAGYAHKAKITFGGYVGESTLTNFPALVQLAEGVGGFSYADCAQANGVDVRFTLGDGLELASECVKWDSTGESQFWVRVPELTRDTVIYMCWGNADAEKRDQRLRVWSDGYTAVWSMDNKGLAIIDVSGNGNHGSASRTLASVSGVVGTARSFSSADSDYARAGKGYDDSFSSPSFSYEGWFKAEANPSSTCSLFGYSTQDGNYNSAATLRDIQLTTAGKIVFRLEDKSYTSSAAVEPGSWHHVAATYDAETKSYALYLDGAVAVSGTFSGTKRAYDPQNRFQFANANHINQKLYFDGVLDELRISRLALPADYFAAVHKNLTDTANFIEIEDLGSEPLPAVEPLPAQTVTISLSAEAGGTVTPSGDVVVEKGGFLEVTASYPTADRLFYAWGGDCPTTAVFSATIRVPADCDRTLVARFGTAYYISPSVESDAIKAGLNQIAADAEADPSVLPAVLQLADGTYPLTDSYVKSGYAYTIATPIAVRAATAGNAILDFKGVDGKTCDGRSAFKLDSMGAVIDGLTFINASEHAAYSDNAVVALVNRGHLLNCTVDAFRERSDSDCCVKVNAGWISRCRFLNATSVQTGTRSYPITLAGGTLMDSCIASNFCGSMATVGLAGTARNCLFVNCSAKHASSGKGGAIQFLHGDGKTGTAGKGVTACAENCTFVNCSAIYGGALAYAQSSVQPVAVNCAFLGNAAANAAQGNDVYQVTLVNCVSANAEAEDGTVVSLPVFTDVVGEPAANSPTRNAGLYARWTTQGEVMDLVGTNRIEEGVLDIGCREFPKPGREPLAVNVTASAYEGRDALVTTFTPTVTGDKTGLTYAWDFGDGETSTETSPTHAYASCGYYTVMLTVANDAGESSVFTKDSFVRVLPSTCYVRTAGESVPTSPYATPETAADRLCDVLSIMPTAIDLGEGDIELGDFCNVTQPMIIRGKGPEKTRLMLDAKGQGGFTSEVRPVFLKHNGAVLADVTVRINGSCNWSTPVGVQAGLVTNCVVCGNRSQNPTAVDIISGALIGCTFSGNTNTYDSSGAVRISGGGVRIENCIFRENLSGNADADSVGSALHVDGNYSPVPVVRNCLFCRNHQASAKGFGVIFANGAVTFDNCTVASNAWTATRGGGGLRVGATAPEGAVVCRNSIFWGNVGSEDGADIRYPEGNALALTACSVGVNPQFKNPTRDDWRIRGGSPCRNAGVKLDWMTDEATDLIGNSRVFGGAPDIGCYESLSGGLMLIVR